MSGVLAAYPYKSATPRAIACCRGIRHRRVQFHVRNELLMTAMLVPAVNNKPVAPHTATGCFPMREFATLTLGYAACELEVRCAWLVHSRSRLSN